MTNDYVTQTTCDTLTWSDLSDIAKLNFLDTFKKKHHTFKYEKSKKHYKKTKTKS